MIVDMVRNDLGRIAKTGSVDVTALFGAERYPTVWQMTSEVRAESAAPFDEILACTFPAASITGAPKARTMEIIDALEPSPRGVYTGIAGYMAPGGDFQFNVAIRTAVIDQTREQLTFGVGSGVTWDSDPRAEYDECLLKARVLGRRAEPFELLETLRWDPDGGYHRRAAHLSRMETSASYFDFACDRTRLDAALDAAVASASDCQRVRLLLTAEGAPRTESFALTLNDQPVRACLAVSPIDDMDPFFFHKTTSRAAYATRRCETCDDVLLWNLRGELTESTLANIVLELDGELVTPPVESGLLAGTERAHAIAIDRIRERPVGVAELARASRLWLINSVRGWRPLVVVSHGTEPAAPPFTTPGA
jgi:para-aminobenzoate synthetase/4-amino-4-deoxychorismate lyase